MVRTIVSHIKILICHDIYDIIKAWLFTFERGNYHETLIAGENDRNCKAIEKIKRVNTRATE